MNKYMWTPDHYPIKQYCAKRPWPQPSFLYILLPNSQTFNVVLWSSSSRFLHTFIKTTTTRVLYWSKYKLASPNLHLNISEAVWDHLDKETKRSQCLKKSFEVSFKKPKELFLKTCLREFRLCWRITVRTFACWRIHVGLISQNTGWAG